MPIGPPKQKPEVLAAAVLAQVGDGARRRMWMRRRYFGWGYGVAGAGGGPP